MIKRYRNPVHFICKYLFSACSSLTYQEFSLQHILFNLRSLRCSKKILFDHQAGDRRCRTCTLSGILHINRDGNLRIFFRCKSNKYRVVRAGFILHRSGLSTHNDVFQLCTITDPVPSVTTRSMASAAILKYAESIVV